MTRTIRTDSTVSISMAPKNPLADLGDVFIKQVQAAQYVEFANKCHADLHADSVVPITRARARILSSNPMAREDDTLLRLIEVDGKFAGYTGFFPGAISVGIERKPISFSNTGFIKPDLRSKGLSELLSLGVLHSGSTCIATGNSRAVEGAFRRMGWKEMAPAPEMRITAVRRLPKRAYFRCLRKLVKSKLSRDGSYEEIKELPEEADALILKKHGFYFYRSPELIRWMIENPWFPENPTPEGRELEYNFAAPKKSVKYRCFRYGSGKNFEGFAVLSVVKEAQTEVKVLDYRFVDSDKAQCLIPLALDVAISEDADAITLPHQLLHIPNVNRAMTRVPYRTFFQSYFYVSEDPEITEALVQLERSPTDGDRAFW